MGTNSAGFGQPPPTVDFESPAASFTSNRGSTSRSRRLAARAFSSSERARKVEPWIRARLPISARRFSSALAPAETPITQMRPPVASAFMFSARFGAPTSSRITSNGPCSAKPSGAIDLGAQRRHLLARLGAAHGRRDACARGFGELDRGRADATRAAVHEQALTGAQLCLGEEGVVGGRERLWQATRRGPVERAPAPASAGARARLPARLARRPRRSPSHDPQPQSAEPRSGRAPAPRRLAPCRECPAVNRGRRI